MTHQRNCAVSLQNINEPLFKTVQIACVQPQLDLKPLQVHVTCKSCYNTIQYYSPVRIFTGRFVTEQIALPLFLQESFQSMFLLIWILCLNENSGSIPGKQVLCFNRRTWGNNWSDKGINCNTYIIILSDKEDRWVTITIVESVMIHIRSVFINYFNTTNFFFL